ncbi:cytochrome d ubiquinol oxidase subunit II, partial [Methylogaea oryzae]
AHGGSADGAWSWLTPYAAFGAAGVVAAYVLFGATYLIIKSEGDIQSVSFRRAQQAGVFLIFAALVVIPWTVRLYPYVAERWARLPAFYYLAGLLALAFAMLLRSLRLRRELSPFFWSVVVFLASAGLMVLSHYPYIVPAAVTAQEAASPSKTLIFMLTGIGMLFPVMLIYNGYQYLVFRGKVRLRKRPAADEA